MKRQQIEELYITLFPVDKLIEKVKILFDNEKEFYEQVVTIVMKLMQNEILNDSERHIVFVNSDKYQDYIKNY
tara:strand:- start:730 stop:948 length:219 start_codon:yes stop_codon:yes gene_type:complete